MVRLARTWSTMMTTGPVRTWLSTTIGMEYKDIALYWVGTNWVDSSDQVGKDQATRLTMTRTDMTTDD